MLTSDSRDRPGFLRLSKELRQQIYSYLLNPLTETPEDVTAINYTLEWPYLENASSSTFLPYQLDRCRCPKAEGIHIYTRYLCNGPDVQFASKRNNRWVLQEPGVQFNILRPASQTELLGRPSASILRVSELIYEEAAYCLYHGRSFLFLTGPSPRGRYQAHATLKWLNQLSKRAKSHVQSLTLICQSFEEDCRDSDALRSFARLSHFIVSDLPNFQQLQMIGWDTKLPLDPFCMLLRREYSIDIIVKKTVRDPGIRISEPAQFFSFTEIEHQDWTTENFEQLLEDTLDDRMSWTNHEA